MGECKMTPVRFPADLLKEIDEYVGPRQRSHFLIEAAQRELLRRKQLEAIHECAGAWNDQDYPELPDTIQGLNECLRKLRGDADRGGTTMNAQEPG